MVKCGRLLFYLTILFSFTHIFFSNKESLIFRIHKAAGFIILWALFLNSLLSVFVFIASTSPSQRSL